MPTDSQSEKYMALSHSYIRQAEEELGRDDVLQAGEKAWGAVSTATKAVAEDRGWFHGHHNLTHEALFWLADESGIAKLKEAFAVVDHLHRNFYENVLTEEEVAEGLERARFILQEVEALRATLPESCKFVPTSNRQRQRWENLTGRKWDDH